MVSLLQLWVPILLAGFAVFVASSIIHMVLPFHKSDYLGLPNEDEVRAAIQKSTPGPGQYVIPYCKGGAEMKEPAMQAKWVEGPVGLLLLRPTGMMNMTPFLSQWFVYTLVVSTLVAYLAIHTLPVGTAYLTVFRVVGTAAWLCYAGGAPINAIWKSVPWRVAGKEAIDGLVYACLTAGVFGWLWPHG
ncbi:MAG: hypothetical protein ABI587_18090 [Gemmatimonadales bacterium]